MNKLQVAFSRKEQVERFLSNLENLRREGTVDEAQYESMKGEYVRSLNEAGAEIEQIKDTLGVELKAKQGELDIYNQELKNLEAKFKVGELSEAAYRKSEKRTQGKIEKIQQTISELERLLEAKSSSDIGGYAEVSAISVEAKQARGAVRPALGRLSLGEIFAEAGRIYKENPIIIIPSLIPAVWSLIALVVLAAGGMAALMAFNMEALVGVLAGLAASVIVYVILTILAEGMTIEMIVGAAEEKGTALLSRGWKAAWGKIVPLIIASILFGVAVTLGSILFIIPGIIAFSFFYFIAQAIMIDNEGVIGSFRASFRLVKSNFRDTIRIFGAMLGIGIVLSLISSVVEILGSILMLAAMPYLMALITLLYLNRR